MSIFRLFASFHLLWHLFKVSLHWKFQTRDKQKAKVSRVESSSSRRPVERRVTCGTKLGCLTKECKSGTFQSRVAVTSSPQTLFEATQWDNKQMTDKENKQTITLAARGGGG